MKYDCTWALWRLALAVLPPCQQGSQEMVAPTSFTSVVSLEVKIWLQCTVSCAGGAQPSAVSRQPSAVLCSSGVELERPCITFCQEYDLACCLPAQPGMPQLR